MINTSTFEDYIREFYYQDLIKIYFGKDAIQYINEQLGIVPHKSLFNDELVFIFSRTKTENISYPLHYNQFKTEYKHWLREKKLKRIIYGL